MQVVSPKNETLRVFKSDFLELFTRVHWSVPLILYVPLVLYCLVRGGEFFLSSPLAFLGILVLAFVIWTLTEYLLHRFFFHYRPKSKALKKIFYLIHEIHHEYPNDSLGLVMPPIESIPVAIILYFGLSYLIPHPFFYPCFAGFVMGYLAYDMIHYSVHHLGMKGRLGQLLKKHHLRHHFQEPNRGYGVSSPFWDRVFRT